MDEEKQEENLIFQKYHLTGSKNQMTLRELTQFQANALRHITFSLTLTCPLQCAHCIVEASASKSLSVMPIEHAKLYASQFKDLAKSGVLFISFTGGEPLLARDQLEILSTAANEAGMLCGVVSSGYWAKTLTSARKTVQRFSSVDYWDISTDIYHQEFVDQKCIWNAYQAIRESGRNIAIRFSYSEPLNNADEQILQFISTMPEAEFVAQEIKSVGRAAIHSKKKEGHHNPFRMPCVTKGIVVRYDGTIGPCCQNLVESRNHPFQFGMAYEKSLTDIYRRYFSHPLLQIIRSIGFSEIISWLRIAGFESFIPSSLPHDVCDLCALIMQNRKITEFLQRKTSSLDMQLKIGVIALQVLGEEIMLYEILGGLSDSEKENPEYRAAFSLIHENK